MFIYLVVARTLKGEWKYSKVPTLEKGEHAVASIEQCLQVYGLNHDINIACEAIPLYQMEQFLRRWSKSKEVRPLALMNSFSKHFNIMWKKISLSTDYISLNPITKLLLQERKETELFANIKQFNEGKLLHLYELQRSIQHHNIVLKLEQLMEFMVKWSFEGKIELLSGLESVQTVKKRYRCRRCSNPIIKHETHQCYSCGNQCYCCPQCVTLGKIKTCSLLIRFVGSSPAHMKGLPQLTLSEVSPIVASYGLSQAQYDAVMTLIKAIQSYYHTMATEYRYLPIRWLNPLTNRKLNYIIWAVTGAGKTEMIFPIIHLFQQLNMKILVTIPRRDVVQELLPRLSSAFPKCKIVGLYGGSDQTWEVGDIYITTTHQLIRFDTYFDLVILDEMDAFPYYNNATLKRTLRRVQKPNSCFIQLTATVPEKERKKMRLGWQRYVQVPVRYHQKPLPVPSFVKLPPLSNILKKVEIPDQLKGIVERSVNRGAVMFMFVQRKVYLEPLSKLLQETFPQLVIAFTSADDRARELKISSFRRREIHVLLTTSILERGVTIAKSDICIMDVHHRAYSRPAIVQMAGRAGRSKDDPNGHVYLCGELKTTATRQAIREIKLMNKLAIRRGYMKGSEVE